MRSLARPSSERARLIAPLLMVLLFAIGLWAPVPARAADGPGTEPLVITHFWGDGCPHCATQRVFLDELVERHPQVVIDAYEVWYDAGNHARFEAMAIAHGIEPSAVPATFLAGRTWIGFSAAVGREIEATVLAELSRRGLGPSPGPEATEETEASVDLPFVGPVSLAGQSLVVATVLVAFVDGFNPCSLWVLSVLLAMMLHARSRARLLAVGLTFLLVTAAIYGLFIVGLFSALAWIGFLSWAQLVTALVVLVFATVAIKDYFWFGRGISFTIPEHRKPAIFRDSRNLMQAQRPLLGIVAGTVVLAAGVALIELPCTAGLPILWTGIVTEQGVAGGQFVLLLGLYLLVYLLDELLVFGAVLATLRMARVEERHGRILKLVSGIVMLTLAATLVIAPATLNSLPGTLAVFGAALGTTLAVLLLHRRVLPRLGIRIGNEWAEIPR
jgi:thiol-disulfide isomerase/thioredoxin